MIIRILESNEETKKIPILHTIANVISIEEINSGYHIKYKEENDIIKSKGIPKFKILFFHEIEITLKEGALL